MFKSWNEFLTWEKASQDTIDVKKVYIDMSGDLLAGIMLSQIVYWYLPSKEGKSKLTVKKECKKTKKQHFWIAKPREEWYDEIRFSKDNVITAMKKLEAKKIIYRQDNMFFGKRTAHIRLNLSVFLSLLNGELKKQVQQLDEFEEYLEEEMGFEVSGDADCQESRQPDCQESRQPIGGNPDNPSSGIQTNITESTPEISTEITSRESFYQNEIQESELPVLIQKVLIAKIDRLILYKINVMDISVLQKTYSDLSSGEFANVLVNVLDSEIKKSFKNKLQTSIDKYIENRNKKQSGSPSNKKKNVGLPEYIEEGNSRPISQEDINSEEENKKWLEELLNQMNQDKKEA